jgi:hypothetical protein
MQLNKVDFPEPLGPINEKISPLFTLREISFKATTPEKRMVTLLTLR